MNQRSVKWLSISAAVLLVVTAGVFLSQTGNGNDADAPDAARKITDISISYDYPVAVNLSQMIQEAELIVIGQYTGFDSSWNMARMIGNPMEEDKSNYTEGHLYRFTIDETLKGGVTENSILVNHTYSEVVKARDSDAVTDGEGRILQEATIVNEFSLTVHDPLFIEPDIGAVYILFLQKSKRFENYYGAIEPFAIKITSDKIASLQSNLVNKTDPFTEAVMLGKDRIINVSIAGPSLEDTVSGVSMEHIIRQILHEANGS